MKISIFYFSGTGNTSWLTRQISSAFSQKGIAISAHSIEKTSIQEADFLISNADIVGFGYPIYGSDLPHNMQNFMGDLSPSLDKKTFVFCTQWKWSGDGAQACASILRQRGFQILWAEHFFMPNNVCTPFLPFKYTNDVQKIEPMLRKAKEKAFIFAFKIIENQSFLRGFNVFSILAGRIQRDPFRKMFPKLRNDISIDEKKCTYCYFCVNTCPSSNFIKEEDSIKTKGECILCLRCYNFCPVSAVMYRKIPHNLNRGIPYRGPKGAWDAQINSASTDA